MGAQSPGGKGGWRGWLGWAVRGGGTGTGFGELVVNDGIWNKTTKKY